MLRSTRVLLLLAIFLILGAVGATYYRQRSALRRLAPPPPQTLPLNTAAAASDWVYNKYDGKRLVAEVRAKGFRQLNEPPRIELEQVELHLFKPDGKQFDRIRCAKAELDQTRDTLYSDGEVDITIGLPAEGPPRGRLLAIRSSGASFDVKTGRASTGRQASFTFELGEGKAVGAVYDPNLRELIMKSQVELHWRGVNPQAKPMTLEASELIYRERESVVLLPAAARLTREGSELNANDSIVTLKDGMIEKVDGKQAHGSAQYPNRRVDYSADKLFMLFDENSEVKQILGERNAILISTSETARTTAAADRLDMSFGASGGENVLTQAVAMGRSSMESAPLPRPGVLTPDTRRLRSEIIVLKMRPDGREIAQVETGAPGHMEFLPNRPGQRHRTLDAERLKMTYGAQNQPELFEAQKASTRTDPEPRAPQDKRPPAGPLLTSSQNLTARFDPQTGQLARLEQWGDFRYEEGERRARSERATLEEARNVITLDQNARVWDTTGSTAAGHIALDQNTGDVAADGNVVSTRLPDKKGASSAMLSGDEPLNAKASHMRTTERNRNIRYEGQVVAWQGANRIWSDTLEIDRTQRRLVAHGNVRTQLIDRQKPKPGAAPAKAAGPPAFVYIQSADLVYTDADRLAHYTGGSHLTRPGLDVKASEIRAYLNDSGSDSSLNRAYADGRVEILSSQPDRTRTGTSEHAEYYAAEQKIILVRGDPTLVDSQRGYTKGAQLTYWANDDKLLVNGADAVPVKTMLKRH